MKKLKYYISWIVDTFTFSTAEFTYLDGHKTRARWSRRKSAWVERPKK